MKSKLFKLILFIFFSLVVLSIFAIFFDNKFYNNLPESLNKKSKKYLNEIFFNLPERTQLSIKLLDLEKKFRIEENKIDTRSFKNDYNVKFLPETHFLKINLKEKKLFVRDGNTLKKVKYTRYIDNYNENFLIISGEGGKFYKWKIKFEDIVSDKNIEVDEINSNLTNQLSDILVFNEKLFVSFYEERDNCKFFKIAEVKINLSYLNFNDFFVSEECLLEKPGGGRIQIIEHDGSKGLLVTTGGYIMNQPTSNPQDNKSVMGKTLFFDFNTKEKVVFSKGHRNPQGLYFDEIHNVILSTEHGPEGGDEINKIEFSQNYGWPISSYGKRYEKVKLNPDLKYEKSHEELNFVEPVFSFVPSIGISEIIKIPNKFSEYWQDNYFVSSLNDKSLYRVKFSKNFNKVLFVEKIFIGERIRDLKYNENENIFILSLEYDYGLGFIYKIN
mgnify:CR=1 FL=1|tara:strand:- start:1720 stop:3048 length:1329 start_codon:yes stop_codon:yes gene_type:complete